MSFCRKKSSTNTAGGKNKRLRPKIRGVVFWKSKTGKENEKAYLVEYLCFIQSGPGKNPHQRLKN